MMTERFTFLSADNRTDIHAVNWSPDDGVYHAVLQITHGMVEYIDRYSHFAEYLTEHGFLVVGMDLLGHGDSVLSEGDRGYFSKKDPSGTLCRDIDALRKMTMEQNPGLPYFMLGHSMGSYMLRKYLGLYGRQAKLNGAIIMGTGYNPPALAGFGLCLARLVATLKSPHYRSKFIEDLTQGGSYDQFDNTGKDPARSWLTKDVEIVRQYRANPKSGFLFTVNGYEGIFEAAAYSCSRKGVEAVPKDLPLLIASGTDDPVGNMGEGVKKVYDMFKTAGQVDVKIKLYKGDRHEILNELDRAGVFEDILGWMEQRL